VGLADDRYLAKVASDMEKPDGLVALPMEFCLKRCGSSRCAICLGSGREQRFG